MKAINVLFITPNSGVDGGSFRSGLKLCELLKETYDVNPIMLLRERGEGEKLAIKAGIKTIVMRYYSWVISNRSSDSFSDRVKMLIKQFLNALAERKIYNLITKNNIDIVHINSATINVGLRAAHKAGAKVIWHARELLEEDQHLTLYKSNWIRDFKKADYIISISDCVRKKYVTIAEPNKVLKIYNGIDEAEYGLKHDLFKRESLQFLCVGSMLGYKGQDEIIDAINIIVKQSPYLLHVTFVGDGKYRNEYEQRIKNYGLENYFNFEGIKTDVVPYYKEADVVLMCSDYEAFGRVTVEAMLAGCFVIGSNTGATPELIGNSFGLLYEKGNSQSLAKAIQWIFENKEKAKIMAANAQLNAKQMFTAKSNAKEIFNVYTEFFVENTKKDNSYIS